MYNTGIAWKDISTDILFPTYQYGATPLFVSNNCLNGKPWTAFCGTEPLGDFEKEIQAKVACIDYFKMWKG
jgi:hypothetical protein